MSQNRVFRCVLGLLVAVGASVAVVSTSATALAADAESVIAQVGVDDAVAGRWSRRDGELVTAAAEGARIVLPVRPQPEYDFRVSFTRRTGQHSIALIFVAGSGQATFEIDAWGEHLAGIQNIGGRSLRENSTRAENQQLQNGRRYTAEVRVRRDRVEGYLDGRLIATYRGNGDNLSMLDVWKMPDAGTLGVGAWDSETVFHSIDVTLPGKNTPLMPAGKATPARPMPLATSRPEGSPRRASVPNASRRGSENHRVLIVIASQDFFYREYAEPREELERAGIVVEVAAARRQTCHPHRNSGEGRDGGAVTPDLALHEVDPDRYDAILFSGGWGSSMYQYAFTGNYSNRVYNGDRQTKQTVNRLLERFVTADKYVAALCHGVSVLAWSRINGRSLLAGKRVTGPTREGPAGIYNGRRDQPVSRWNSEVNGARMVPPNSVGNPGTAADDIVVDGKILTGQDDISAREMGRQLARLLLTRSRQAE